MSTRPRPGVRCPRRGTEVEPPPLGGGAAPVELDILCVWTWEIVADFIDILLIFH